MSQLPAWLGTLVKQIRDASDTTTTVQDQTVQDQEVDGCP
jgi:hypothetical protein